MTRTIAICITLASVAAAAQAPREGIARLKDVKGNVLISREAGLSAGGEATRVTEHTRVITTANSEVIVVYDNGCEVRLKENQRFEVEDDKPCAVLVAMPQSILATPVGTALAGASAGGGIFGTTLPALGGAAIGVSFLDGARRKNPLSPS
ncbi:MAG TPA: hypothetical protein VM029_15415 [Opitutaceae bacterium]|nr:hypothetical protein [Opitutaceae bacterium]